MAASNSAEGKLTLPNATPVVDQKQDGKVVIVLPLEARPASQAALEAMQAQAAATGAVFRFDKIILFRLTAETSPFQRSVQIAAATCDSCRRVRHDYMDGDVLVAATCACR